MNVTTTSSTATRRRLSASKRLLLAVTSLTCTISSIGGVFAANPTIVGSSTDYASKGTIKIQSPPNITPGDVLLLFLNRSDGPLPIELGVGGWTNAAVCLKQHNEWEQCITSDHCVEFDQHENGDVYCKKYQQKIRHISHNRLDGEDLGTSVFFKTATAEDVEDGKLFEWDLDGTKPGWAILVGIQGADTSSPIRDWAGITCDTEHHSRFPSVYAQSGDLLLFHQGYDDATTPGKFGPPVDTAMVAWTTGEDETAFLFERPVLRDGETGEYVTTKDGGPKCKDVQITMSVAAAPPPPTSAPSDMPSSMPSMAPTSMPSSMPSSRPSLRPTTGSGNRGGDDETPDVVITTEQDLFMAASSSNFLSVLATGFIVSVVGAVVWI